MIPLSSPAKRGRGTARSAGEGAPDSTLHLHCKEFATREAGAENARSVQAIEKNGRSHSANPPHALLLQPHAWAVAIGERDAGFFERMLDGFDGARLQRFAAFEAHDRAGRDMGQLRQIAHTQFQGGSRHAALGSVHR